MNVEELEALARSWFVGDPDESTRRELTELLDSGRTDELEERFSGPLQFGTAGLRAILGAGPARMNRAVVRRASFGLAQYLKRKTRDLSAGVVVARDARRMSAEFAEDTAAVLNGQGIPTWVFAEPVPTPLAAFACQKLSAIAGVVVTASHNPPAYNGYKVYSSNGAQIVPPEDVDIARAIAQAPRANEIPILSQGEAEKRGLFRALGPEVGEQYLQAILELRPYGRGSSKLRLVYTPLHGVGGKWAMAALSRAGFHVSEVAEQHQPDAAFPTVRFPNPEEPGAMDLAHALAERMGAELVLANDPDADRLAVTVRDSRGALMPLSGNELGVLLGHFILTQKKPLPENPLVITTLVSSTQLGDIAKSLGVRHEETLTGFKWIANRAMALSTEEKATFLFGYEEALGYAAGSVVRDKDGISAALLMADLAAFCESQGWTVAEYLQSIQRRHGLFLAQQKSVTLPGAAGSKTIAAIMEAFRKSPPSDIGGHPVKAVRDYKDGGGGIPSADVLAFSLEGGARVTLRPSGTEPKIKYYFELKEALAEGEEVSSARARGMAKLKTLQDGFIQLAQARGQP